MTSLQFPGVAYAQAARRVASAAERSIARRIGSKVLVRRAATRTTAKGVERKAGSILARDMRNHKLGNVVRLPSPRTVTRYTTVSRGRSELRRGIPAMRHMTSRGGPGRPLNSSSATRALGLARKPTARLTVRVPKGQPVILNRIPGGAPGRGELVSPRRLPPSAVKRLVKLSKW
jgi:hypothetical protein